MDAPPLQIAPQTGGGGGLVVHAEQTVVGGGEQNFALLARTHPSHVRLCHPTLVVKAPLHQDDGQVTFIVANPYLRKYHTFAKAFGGVC